jgi:peptide/nickel transport system permease protein
MLRYTTHRAAQLGMVLFIVSIMVFAIVRSIPGDPVTVYMGMRATPETIAAAREKYGLDEPAPMQYLKWAGNVVQGDLGNSIRANRPVLPVVLERLPATLLLTAASVFIGMIVAFVVATWSVYTRSRLLERFLEGVSFFGLAVPIFVTGIFLILIFALWFPVLPGSGYASLVENPLQALRHLALPALTLGFWTGCALARILRAEILDNLDRDFARTARGKGVGELAVFLKHVVRLSLLPALTTVGLQFGFLLGGAVLVEYLFGWPGIGRLALFAVNNRDYPVIQGVVLVTATLVVGINLLVDLIYAYLDPRIRYD